jgi:hypothetical protein
MRVKSKTHRSAAAWVLRKAGAASGPNFFRARASCSGPKRRTARARRSHSGGYGILR